MNAPNSNDMILFLSHQVRTSLSGMLGYVEKLYDSQNTAKEKLTTLSKLRNLLENTSAVLEDAEHLASIEKGSFSIRSLQFSLEDEITETIHFLEAYSRKSQLKFRVNVVGKVPAIILSDPLRTRQMITQMVCHEVQVLDRGTIQLNIKLSENNELIFNVDTTGNNYPENCLSTMGPLNTPCDIFTLPHNHGRHAIVLPLLHALATSLGGNLRIEKSVLGKGYSISASINPGPVIKEQLTDRLTFKKIEESSGVKSIVIPDFSNKQFLIVEDDEDISALLTHFLKQTGAQVYQAADGETALRLALTKRFDILFLDIQLPKLNGIEICSKLRKAGINTPVIALTASTAVATKKQCLNAGFNLFLTKPLSIDSIYQIIPKMAV